MAGGRDWDEQVAAAATLVQPFALLSALLLLIAPPAAAAFAAADPLVRSIAMTVGLFAIPGAALAVLPLWLWLAWPSAPALRRSLQLAAAGAALAIGVSVLLRLLVGPHLPGFIPPEESAAPGLPAGLAAGLIEEVAIRLAVLPAALFLARRLLPPAAAAIAAVLAAAAVFTLLHQVGPGAAPFAPAHALTRFLFPGVVMSAAAIRPGPALVCVGHCAAHLMIPLCFA
jgi:hypothetical protein